jgi:putative peptidoglycan lipid II flippase
MIKKILHSKINSIAMAAFLVAFSSLASRLLGVIRDRILASSFGAGDALDVYYAAFRLPDMIYNLLVLGALSAGFIPLFAKKLKREGEDQAEAWQVANNLINILGFSLLVISLLGIIFAPGLMHIFTPGFDADKQLLSANLSRIMFLSPIILGLSGIVGGVLQSFKRFFIYSLSPIFYNIGIIIGALYFVPLLGISGLAWGVIFGASMHLLIQLPTLYSLGFNYRFTFNLRSPEVKKIFSLMVPRTLALAISQVDLLVSTAIASTLSIGSLSIFNFANNLQFFPIGIFGISFATAAFPVLAEHAHEPQKMIGYFSKVMRQILFFIIPASVIFWLLRVEIIQVVLGGGAFDWAATVLTFKTLGFFIISLFAQASIPLLVRMYYAREDSLRPFYVGLATVAIDIVLAWTLSRLLGVGGIALAFSIASIINFLLLWLVLEMKIGDLDKRRIFTSASFFCLAAGLAGLAGIATKLAANALLSSEVYYFVLIKGMIIGAVFGAVYLLCTYLFKNEEAQVLVSRFHKKISSSDLRGADQSEARGI